jgi:hypothetical protein
MVERDLQVSETHKNVRVDVDKKCFDARCSVCFLVFSQEYTIGEAKFRSKVDTNRGRSSSFTIK